MKKNISVVQGQGSRFSFQGQKIHKQRTFEQRLSDGQEAQLFLPYRRLDPWDQADY